MANELLTLRVYSDFVCPYCFFAEEMLRHVEAEKHFAVEWMPFELRPSPQPTLRPEGDYLQQAWQQSVYPLAKRLGIRITLPSISPQPHTGLAFEGYQFAVDHGQGSAYTHRLFTAFFQDGLNIGDLNVLGDVAEALTLDRAAFCQALETGHHRERHRAALRHAYIDQAITAVPTFIVGRNQLRGLPIRRDLETFLNEARAGSSRFAR